MSVNPYGLADSVSYNYFAHIRKVLYGEQRITTAKKLTLQEYLNAHTQISGYFNTLCARIEHANKTSRVGGGIGGIHDQIAIDKLYLERNAMQSAVQVHDHLLYLLQTAPQQSLSFAKLIDTVTISRDHLRREVVKSRQEAANLKRTLMEEPLRLWHSSLT